MPKPTLTFPILSLFLVFFYFNLGGFFKTATGQGTWCVANPSSTDAQLSADLDYACSHVVDCSQIQQGSICFYPNTFFHHASFAMNLYYQNMGRDTPRIVILAFIAVLMRLVELFYQTTKHHQILGVWQTYNRKFKATININFTCTHVNCSPIQDGGSCFNPTTLMNHASFAMNLYYQSQNRRRRSCEFQDSGIIVNKNPSYGNCTFVTDH